VWADAKTGLLLHLEHVGETPGGRTELTYTNFKFDEQFDDALFSVQPPAGYKVAKMPVAPITAEDLKNFCQMKLKHIGIAILMYLNGHEHQYPESLDDLLTYFEGRQALVCPGSHEEGYVYEKPVTPWEQVAEARSVITAYDKPGNHEGGRNVLFLDGHVQWLTEEEFQKLWAGQHTHPAVEHSPPAQEGETP
jgi:prepilin-type processing-associated H-X9-DG protein